MNESEPSVGGRRGTGPWVGGRHLIGAVVACVLLVWGVVQPLVWPYLVGALLVGVVCGVVAHRVLVGCLTRAVSRILLAVVIGALVASAMVAVPGLARLAATNGSIQWRTELPTRWVDVLPLGERIYLYEEFRGFRVLDRETGEELFSVGGVQMQGVLARDGSMVLYNDEVAEYYGADGRRVWRIDRPAALVSERARDVSVYAAADGVVAFAGCPRSATRSEECRYFGIGRTGEVLWQRDGIHQAASDQVLYAGLEEFDLGPLPSVVVARASTSDDAEVVTLAAADGRVLDRRAAGGNVGAVGDLVVFTGADQAGCSVTGVRSGRRVWRATGLPCSEGGAPLRTLLLLEHRMYAHTAGERDVTVDLDDGSWRQVAHVGFSYPATDAATIGLPGDDVIVYRDTQTLTAVDAETGRRLWTFEAPGDQIPGVDVGDGAVVVLSRPGGHNPMIFPDERDSGYLVTVLHPRTGDTTARTLPTDGVATLGPVANRKALVVTENDPEARLIG